MNQSFGKEYRLLNSQDFNYLRKDSLKFNNPFFRVYFKKTLKSQNHSRVGLSVSKKVCKANLRNKLKRHYREFFRCSELRELGLDIFLVISPHLFRKNSEQEGFEHFHQGLDKLQSYLINKGNRLAHE